MSYAIVHSTHSATRPRPALFRALGDAEPPAEVTIAGATYRLVEVLKHDSWAATALYQGRRGRVVCKFNRQQSIGKMPMGWLGRFLARREAWMMRRLDDLPNVPRCPGDVYAGGKLLENAVAHDY